MCAQIAITEVGPIMSSRSVLKGAVAVSVILLQACGGGSGGGADVVTPSNTSSEVFADVALSEGNGSLPVSNGSVVESQPAMEQAAALVVEPVSQVSQTIASFDTATDRVSNWTYINGNEYPGAKGGLTQVVSDKNGTNSARLSYDLGCSTTVVGVKTAEACGRYVGMTINLAQPVDVAAVDAPFLSFSFKDPQSMVDPFVRVIDGTGQTLQYKVYGRSVEYPVGGVWQKLQFPLSKPKTYYGGANDGVLHSPIRGLFIGVGSFTLQVPAGYIEIDDVAILKTPSRSFKLSSSAAVGVASKFPTYVGRLAATTYTSMPSSLDKAKAVGINIIRRDMLWSKVEKNGVFDFTEYDGIAANIATRGMSVVWILRGGHLDHGGVVPVTDADRAAFAKFAAAAATNYKGRNVSAYEIWNEPNGVQFWPNQDPLDYAKLLNLAAAAIKKIDATVKVVTGGTAGIDFNYTARLAGAVTPAAIDAVGFHPYALKSSPETLAYGVAPLGNLLMASAVNKPLWNTEWGISSFGDIDAAVYGNGFAAAARNRQAVLVARTILTQLAVDVPFITIHSLVDYGSNATNRENNFGLLTNDGSDKPGIFAMRMLAAAQSGRSFKGALSDVPPGLHVVKWESGTDRVFVIWADDAASGSFKISIPSSAATVKRWDGLGLMNNLVSGYYEVALSEGDGPIVTRIPK